MLTNLPAISGCGTFYSQINFPHNTITEIRTLKTYELEFFLEDGGISFINDEEYPIKMGNILLGVPGDKRKSKLHFKCLFMRFNFHDDGLAEQLRHLSRVINTKNYIRYSQMFERIIQSHLSFEESSDLISAGLILQILYRFKSEDIYHINFENNQNIIIKSAFIFIEKHYTEQITVKNISEHCSISTPYLYKLFSQAVGISPNAYIGKKRITLSKKLLTESDLPLCEIAIECGLNSQAYFCYYFKKEFGISPGKFRKANVY